MPKTVDVWRSMWYNDKNGKMPNL